jgi:teichuronic acid biosynthesis glycosyltransferase TuaG
MISGNVDPYFSVILPVYNGAECLDRAIESVKAQTETSWELIAVDDGSTDSSWDTLNELAANDKRVRLYRTQNSGGPGRPRNKAINESRGRAICFLDQDDYWLPEKLKLQRPLVELPGVGIVHGDAWFEEAGIPRRRYSEVWGPIYSGAVTKELIESNFIPAVTAVVPASVARSVGPLDERLIGVDEYHWWLRIAMAGYHVVAVADPVAVHTMSNTNLSWDHDRRLDSLDRCLRDLANSHVLWRDQLLERREKVRVHAFDYFANRLAVRGIVDSGGVATALRVAKLTRTWPETKRFLASAIPPALRPRSDDGSAR